MKRASAGFLAPLLALFFAALFADMAWQRYVLAHSEAGSQHALRSLAAGVGHTAPDAQLAATLRERGVSWAILHAEARPEGHAYLPRFSVRASDGLDLKAGLRAQDLRHKAVVDAAAAARPERPQIRSLWQGRDGSTMDGLQIAQAGPQNLYTVLRMPTAAWPQSAQLGRWLIIGTALLAALLWWLLLRARPPSPWLAPAGATVSLALLEGGLFYAHHNLAAQAAQWQAALAAAMGQGAGASMPAVHTVLAAPVVPLVLVAVAGARSLSRRSPHRLAFAYVAPALFALSLLVLVPFVYGIGLAFYEVKAGEQTFVGLAHFVEILSNVGQSVGQATGFYFTLGVTILWTALNVALHAGIGLALALVLNLQGLRLTRLWRVLLIVPWAVPNYITALIWKGMFNQQYGLINRVLGAVGVEPVAWFSGFFTAFAANLTTNTWLGFPFMMVVSLGALQSIPRDVYEAADLDGISRWQQFRHITAPLLRPALVPALILGSVWTFNMFNVIYLVSGGQPQGRTEILITEAYRLAFEQGRYGQAAAYSLLIFVVLLLYSALTHRISKGAEEAAS